VFGHISAKEEPRPTWGLETYYEIICSSSAVTIIFPFMAIASQVISTV
jgi:hypothetical protein